MLAFEIKNIAVEFATSPDLFSPKSLDSGTKLLLEEISKNDYNNAQILDWGCGWGAMALWLGKAYSTSQVTGIDSDIGAVMVAKQNAALNDLTNVDIMASHGFSEISENNFDLIVSNPPTHRGREVVEQMIAESFNKLKTNGTLTIVAEARLKPWVYKQMKQVFGECKIIQRGKKHVVLSSSKML